MVIPVDTKVKFNEDFTQSMPLVFSVDDAIIDRVKEGAVCIKSNVQGICFLCDGERTYRIRLVENSNTQYVVGSEKDVSFLRSSFPGIVALDPIFCAMIPDLEIESAFNRYSGSPEVARLISNETIWSERQILSHMQSNRLYYVMDGRWRRLTNNSFFHYMDVILKTCAIVGKSGEGPDRYNSEEVWTRMNEILRSESEIDFQSSFTELPIAFVQYLLSRLSPCNSEPFKNKGESEWSLNIPIDRMKVVSFRAQQILHNRFMVNSRMPMNVSRFVSELRDVLMTTASVDPHLVSDDKQLNALVPNLIEGFGTVDGDLILSFDPSLLSIDLDKRINELFKIKARWLKSEFETLITAILPPEAKPESILMKSCRIEQEDDGKTYYSSKF